MSSSSGRVQYERPGKKRKRPQILFRAKARECAGHHEGFTVASPLPPFPTLSVVPPQRAFAESILRGLFGSRHHPTGGVAYAAKGFGRVRVTVAAAAAAGIRSITLLTPDGPGGARRESAWRAGTAAAGIEFSSWSGATLVSSAPAPPCAPLVVVDDVRFVKPEVLLGSPFYAVWRPVWILGWTAVSPPKKLPVAIEETVGPVVLRWAGEWGSAPEIPSGGHRIEGGHYLLDKSTLVRGAVESVRRALSMNRSDNAPQEKRRSGSGSGTDENVFRAYVETDTHLAVPRFWGIEHFGLPAPPSSIHVCAGEPMAPEALRFEGRLKTSEPDQRGAVDAFLAATKSAPTSGTLLNLYCGAGKTVTAIAAALEHGRATVVLVSNSDLLSQWEERIRAFAPGAIVGRYQQDVDTSKGADFTVAMLQSVAARDLPVSTAARWGLVIVDECHCVGSRVFSAAMAKIPAAHVLGLSATAYRRDGLEKLLFGSIGPIRFEAIRDAMVVHVKLIERDPPPKVAAAIGKIVARGGKSSATMGAKALALNELALCDEDRTCLIADEIIAATAVLRRAVLVLSNRIAQLEDIYRLLCERWAKKEGAPRAGLFTGKVSAAQRAEVLETADVILATYNKAKEGLDVPRLDTLVLATPVADVVQSCGRILRVYPPGKNTPLIIDIWDRVEPVEGSGHARRRWYRGQGYRIQRYQGNVLAVDQEDREDDNDDDGQTSWLGMDDEFE